MLLFFLLICDSLVYFKPVWQGWGGRKSVGEAK